MCCYTAVAAAVAVSHRVPDRKICSRDSLHLIPVFLFLFIQILFIFYVPLGSTVAFSASIFLHIISYILGNTGMRGAKAGVSPPRRSPPGVCIYIYGGTAAAAVSPQRLELITNCRWVSVAYQ